ncbi:MAG: hypothetical protein CXT67_03685 [Methanobacteriota archaeon]|jgi:hypothetical protein|nr:MAG: hypothetical protein CXT67_03685 [Euryarchaeota archaeon]HIG19398.1 hypothetical protein [Candidatus Poseidoniales archaeon]
MQRKVQWIVALLLALMISLPASVVASGGDDDDDRNDIESENKSEDDSDDDREDREKHKVDVDVSSDQITVKMKREIGDSESKIEFKTDLSEGKFKLKFEEENSQIEAEQKLEVKLQQLVEFVDGNGNGAYDEGEIIASAYRIGDSGDLLSGSPDNGSVNWGTPTLEDITISGKIGTKMVARGSFGDTAEGTFGLDMMVFGDFTTMSTSEIRPTDVKIDFIIENYPYTRNDSAVGLMMKTKTKQEQERNHHDLDNDEEGVVAASNTEMNTISLSFSWKDTATIDGVDLPVHTTVLKSQTDTDDDEFEFKQQFVLSYARGTVIVHDPVAGVGYSSITEDAGEFLGFLPGFGILATLSVIGIMAIALRPKQN